MAERVFSKAQKLLSIKTNIQQKNVNLPSKFI